MCLCPMSPEKHYLLRKIMCHKNIIGLDLCSDLRYMSKLDFESDFCIVRDNMKI